MEQTHEERQTTVPNSKGMNQDVDFEGPRISQEASIAKPHWASSGTECGDERICTWLYLPKTWPSVIKRSWCNSASPVVLFPLLPLHVYFLYKQVKCSLKQRSVTPQISTLQQSSIVLRIKTKDVSKSSETSRLAPMLPLDLISCLSLLLYTCWLPRYFSDTPGILLSQGLYTWSLCYNILGPSLALFFIHSSLCSSHLSERPFHVEQSPVTLYPFSLLYFSP